jgi:hypothetical protein
VLGITPVARVIAATVGHLNMEKTPMSLRAVRTLLLASTFLCAHAYASDESDVVHRMQETIDAANKDIDPATLAANFAPSVVLVDDLAPFVFEGAASTALTAWLSAYAADSDKNHVTDFSMRLLKPRRVEVAQDRAYVILPAIYRFKQHDKPAQERGVITATLVKIDSKWLIATWSWAAE